MSRKYLLFFLFLILYSVSYGQKVSTNNLYNGEDLYFQAVKTFVDSTFNTLQDTVEVIFVKNLDLINYLPSKIGKTNVLLLFATELKDKYDKLKNATMRIYSLEPMFNDKAEITVVIQSYNYYNQTKDNNLIPIYEIADWASVTFVYDCSTERFKYYRMNRMKNK